MENASKALIMAASVLIGVVIISLTAYLFTYFGGSVNEMNQQIEEGQIQQFNNQFTSYEAKGKNLTVYDVVTVTNLARENNTYYGLTESSANNFYIEVRFNSQRIETFSENQLTNLLNQDLDVVKDEKTGEEIRQLKRYACKVTLNPNTGRVNQIIFS